MQTTRPGTASQLLNRSPGRVRTNRNQDVVRAGTSRFTCSLAVAVCVAGHGDLHTVLDALPSVAGGVLGAVPVQARLAAVAVPVAAQVVLDGVEVATGVARVRRVSVAVRGLVLVVVGTGLVVGTVAVVLAPVGVLVGRVDGFARRLARQAAGYRADDGADGATNNGARTGNHRTDGGPGRATAGRADAGADGVRPGRARNRVAVRVAVRIVRSGVLSITVGHDALLSRWIDVRGRVVQMWCHVGMEFTVSATIR